MPDLPFQRAGEGRDEIERTYLLRALPAIPEGAEVLQIEQGYLPEKGQATADERYLEGRLRRTVAGDGSVRLTHTIKRGSGVRRTEIERAISADEFERYWPLTEGRRLRKRRYRASDAGAGVPVLWEIDEFVDLGLVLAEVELPSVDEKVVFPSWLAPHVVREVTDEPSYRNYSLAVHGLEAGEVGGQVAER